MSESIADHYFFSPLAPAINVRIRDVSFHQPNILKFVLDFTEAQNQPAAHNPFLDMTVQIYAVKSASNSRILVKEFFSDKVRSPKTCYDIELNNLPPEVGAEPRFQFSVKFNTPPGIFSI